MGEFHIAQLRQHSFEAEYSRKDCEEMIENYVVWGGDRGLTEKTMRAACGLPARDVRQATNATSRLVAVVEIDDASDTATESKEWNQAQVSMISAMLAQRKAFFSHKALMNLKVANGPNVTKEGLIQGLVDKRLCYATGRDHLVYKRAKKTETFYFPLLTTEKTSSSIKSAVAKESFQNSTTLTLSTSMCRSILSGERMQTSWPMY